MFRCFFGTKWPFMVGSGSLQLGIVLVFICNYFVHVSVDTHTHNSETAALVIIPFSIIISSSKNLYSRHVINVMRLDSVYLLVKHVINSPELHYIIQLNLVAFLRIAAILPQNCAFIGCGDT